MNVRIRTCSHRPELVRAAGLFWSRSSRPLVPRITATQTATVERETEDQLFHRRSAVLLSTVKFVITWKRALTVQSCFKLLLACREGSGPFSTGKWRVQFKRDKGLPCQRCGGASKLICHACSGAGRLGKGGYHEKNPINSARLVGAQHKPLRPLVAHRAQEQSCQQQYRSTKAPHICATVQD